MSKDKTNQNGITLIALIITIIVMLILVGVTVNVALNGGLFITAQEAAKGTEAERDKEQELASGDIIDEWVNGEPISLPDGWSKTTKPEEWNNDKVIAITDGTNIVPLPEGFKISEVSEEQTLSNGLVITDGANEFVWIPYAETYTEDDFGPLTGKDTISKCVYDSQEQLDYYYGEGYFNYSQDFNYAQDKINIETSINKYKGFYVGRYETTYDSTDENGVPQGIGVKKGKNVLTADKIFQAGKNTGQGKSGEAYYYRWYGLYKVQKDMYAQDQAVFSTMITSKEWDIIIKEYGDAKRGIGTYTTTPDKSGSAYKGTTDTYDVSKNIYDLAGNLYEYTLKAISANNANLRVIRGGICIDSRPSASSSFDSSPSGADRLRSVLELHFI